MKIDLQGGKSISQLPLERFEKALYGVIASLAVIMFATLSVATYAPNIEAYFFFLGSVVALVVMALTLVASKIVKALIISRSVAEWEAEKAEEEGADDDFSV